VADAGDHAAEVFLDAVGVNEEGRGGKGGEFGPKGGELRAESGERSGDGVGHSGEGGDFFSQLAALSD
jgi:hypothetical protein